jgi:DNA-binding transcriptional ArsR family regulator
MSDQLLLDRVLDALGDPMRRRIVEQLAQGPRPVGELSHSLPIGRPAVSRHLRVLGDAGLVHHNTQGTRNFYELAPQGRLELHRWLSALWDSTLGSYAAYVASHPEGQDRS